MGTLFKVKLGRWWGHRDTTCGAPTKWYSWQRARRAGALGGASRPCRWTVGSASLCLLPSLLPSQVAVGSGRSAAPSQGSWRAAVLECRLGPVRNVHSGYSLTEGATLEFLELRVQHELLLWSDACWRLQTAALNFREKFPCPIGDLKSD